MKNAQGKNSPEYLEDAASPGVATDLTHDPVAEKKPLRKIDMRMLPPLFVLFLLAFLDRTNIGNAKIQGMTKELNMGGHDYNVALFVFFVSCRTVANNHAWLTRLDSIHSI